VTIDDEPQPRPGRPGWFQRRHRGLFWAAILLCLALAGAGAIYAYHGYRNGRGADGAVRGYLHALADGDAPRALSYGTIPGGERSFLSSDVLRDQLKIAPMRGITIGADSSVGGDVKVSFSYDLAFARGTQHVADTVLVRKVGDRWQLDRVATPVSITVLSAADRATLAGAAVPTGSTLLFPGAVPVLFDSPYLRLTLATDQLPLSHNSDLELTVELTPAARKAAITQLGAMLTACGRGGSGAGIARCPVPSDDFVPGSMSGTLALDPSSVTLGIGLGATGTILITGEADFDGGYRLLDFNDVAHVHRGKLSVPFTAQAFAVSPLVVGFEVQS